MGILVDLLKPEENVYFGEKISGTIQQVVAGPTAEALREFGRQEPEFKQAMQQSDKAFQACLDSIAQLCDDKDGVSDLDVFRAAVKFYFPNYTMEISNSYEIEQCRGRHNNTAGNPKPPTVRRFEEIYARQLDRLWNKRWRKAKRLQRPPRPEPPKHYYRRKKARAAVPAA